MAEGIDSSAVEEGRIVQVWVRRDAPGVTVFDDWDSFGQRTTASGSVQLDQVQVQPEDVVPAWQFEATPSLSGPVSQLIQASIDAGIAQGALDVAVQYSRERRQFGKPIAAFQGPQFMLADMATQVEAARTLVYEAARHIDRGAKEISKISAMCKLFASNVAMRVTTDAVQILGGYGYMKDYPVEKMMRDAKITQIYEGTSEVQKIVISRSVLG
jgi:alkylation response protein AidB-like acyl-CoA dehydrogenase